MMGFTVQEIVCMISACETILEAAESDNVAKVFDEEIVENANKDLKNIIAKLKGLIAL